MRPTAITALEGLAAKNLVSWSDSILVLGGTDLDANTLLKLGFQDITILNLDKDAVSRHGEQVKFEYGDAMDSGIADSSFDITFTSDCLHHCTSPHRALTEMYRIARKVVIVLESRDSLLMRVANRMGFSQIYEILPKNLDGYGGVNNSEIPNFIYRWTEREFEKAVRSFDPTINHRFVYEYDINYILKDRVKELRNPLIRWSISVFQPLVKVMHAIFPKQCNTFVMTAIKDVQQCSLMPWLERRDGLIRPKASYYEDRFRT